MCSLSHLEIIVKSPHNYTLPFTKKKMVPLQNVKDTCKKMKWLQQEWLIKGSLDQSLSYVTIFHQFSSTLILQAWVIYNVP